MSANLTAFGLPAAVGILAGYALACAQLWRTSHALRVARYDASHDHTTGLANRRALMAYLDGVLGRGLPVAVALLDLDRFKAINDAFGHNGGDDALREVARRLSALPAPVKLAVRLSGDEFALVVRGNADEAMAAAQAAWQAIAGTPVAVGDEFVDVSASVGVAVAGSGTTRRQLVHDADLAMYQAKMTGTAVRMHLPTSMSPLAVGQPLPDGTDRTVPDNATGLARYSESRS